MFYSSCIFYIPSRLRLSTLSPCESLDASLQVLSVAGEIVPVQGGHILRSTGRKDRHSKVFTAKGPRDRRVRLSAHTAIRFYDVQDRLGYDRPSKAVDWLIKKAKFAIDKLQELPPYFPIANGFTDPNPKTGETESSEFGSQLHLPSAVENFAPPLESLFPMSSATTSTNFQGYPVNFILRPTDPARDLALSLHNLHDSPLIPSEEDGNHSPANDQRLISDSIPAGYEGDEAGLWLQQPLLGQNSAAAFSQRVSVQASLGHSLPIRGWSNQNRQLSVLGGRFDGSSELRTPSRIRGEGREDGVVSGTHSSPPNYRR